jgi:ABC-type multidrug transport system fused ATPase/permease subunit
VFFVMDLPSEQDADDAGELPPIREGMVMEGLRFSFPDGTEALSGIDFEARLGETVAFVGATGAGKTTLASMIPRFLTPSEGRVLLDGVDIAGVSMDSLRSQIAFVFQETTLFEGTVAQNIRVGRPQASETDLRRAARAAGADEFISRLPQGYDTPLGVAGGKLSVGQKQRLSIARALLREAPILILDEPTSALDPETEQQLVRTLREVGESRLVIVIAHRLSTIRASNQICFLADGQIIERGSHPELMALPDGAYRSFVELQTQGAA